MRNVRSSVIGEKAHGYVKLQSEGDSGKFCVFQECLYFLKGI